MQSVYHLSSKPPPNPSGPTPSAYLKLTAPPSPPGPGHHRLATNHSSPSFHPLNLLKVHTQEHHTHVRVSTCSLGRGVREGRAIIRSQNHFPLRTTSVKCRPGHAIALQWLPTLLGATGRASQGPPARPLGPLDSPCASRLLCFIHTSLFLPQGPGTCCSCPPLSGFTPGRAGTTRSLPYCPFFLHPTSASFNPPYIYPNCSCIPPENKLQGQGPVFGSSSESPKALKNLAQWGS